MKTTKALFFELMYDFQSECWNEFELPKLSLRELLALAKLLGCPSCGSKETVIVRLLAQRELRLKLARFTDNPEELAISYKRESLRDMCREAGIWRSGGQIIENSWSIWEFEPTPRFASKEELSGLTAAQPVDTMLQSSHDLQSDFHGANPDHR